MVISKVPTIQLPRYWTIIVYLIALTNYCCQCRKQVNIEIEIYDVRQLSQREPQEMLL